MRLGRLPELGVVAAATACVLVAVRPALVEGSAALPTTWNLTHTCTFCHDPHGGPQNANLLDEDVEVLCLTCHGPGGIAATKADNHKGHSCLDCHDKHLNLDNWLGGENIRQVGREDPMGLAVVTTKDGNVRDVVFESRGTDAGQPSLHSFADDDEDGNGVHDGICEVCHVEEEQENHNFGRTCTDCHLHEDEFDEP